MQGKPCALQPRGEARAVDALRDNIARELLSAADVVHRHDVRMIETGDRAGFGQIGLDILRSGQQIAMWHLDRH